MPINVISTNQFATVTANTANDVWVVTANTLIAAGTGSAIDGSGVNGNKSFLIYGNLIAESKGLVLGDFSLGLGGSNNVHIYSGGSIFSNSDDGIRSYGSDLNLINEGSVDGESGVVVDSNNTIQNFGTITGRVGAGILSFGIGLNTINYGAIAGGSSGILSAHDDAEIHNFGSIFASGAGIDVQNNAVVENDGTITSTTGAGIVVLSGASVANRGTIVSARTGIDANSANSTIVNSGQITVTESSFVSSGIEIGSNSTLVNSGDILVQDLGSIGISATTGISSFTTILNSGLIAAETTSFLGGLGAELLTNTAAGLLEGDVQLGDGADSLINLGMIDGTVYADAGNDVLEIAP